MAAFLGDAGTNRRTAARCGVDARPSSTDEQSVPMDAPPPPRVARPVMLHRWTHQTFLHWPYPPEVVQRLLPAELEVETFDGQAWVGLLPFLMEKVRVPGVPPLPWASRFPETNLRTYVSGPDGQSAIWFFSLDAARLGAVLAARATYWLRYCWADMAVEQDGARVRYRSSRRWPGPRGAHCRATIEVGDLLDSGHVTELDHFLTARYVLYTVIANRLAHAHAEHGAWPWPGPEWWRWTRTSSRRESCPPLATHH